MKDDLGPVFGYERDGSEIRDPVRFVELIRDHAARFVRKTIVKTNHGDVLVSTMFMVADLSGEERPRLYQTLVTETTRAWSARAWHYFTPEAAQEGHADHLALMRLELTTRGRRVIRMEEVTP